MAFNTPRILLFCVALLVVAGLSACSHRVVRRTVLPEDIATLDGRSPFLKVHFADGRLCLLKQWSVDDDTGVVSGKGHFYDANRAVLASGNFEIGVDSVAVFETNVLQTSNAVAPLAIVGGISLAVTIACATNPKACFGSCPTFYVLGGGDDGTVGAEGFSSSVAPWLEASDIDALAVSRPGGGPVTLRMTNEALETHVVRRADLLACAVGEGERVFKDAGGAFHRARSVIPPVSCAGPEGEAVDRVRGLDGDERWSLADSTDLAARETLELRFDTVPDGSLGLVVGARQSLLTTFLLYETLSAMGGTVGRWLAAGVDSGPDSSLADALGGIEVQIHEGNGWRTVASVGEHGPIATDLWVVPLPDPGGAPPAVRLRLTRGAWRVDYLALAALAGTVTPARLAPETVRRRDVADDDALAALWDDENTVVTFPGDALMLSYRLPADAPRYELFLESRGYYLEWMRDEWLEDEDPAAVVEMLVSPDRALARLAPEYKKVEASMENAFWRSRYASSTRP